MKKIITFSSIFLIIDIVIKLIVKYNMKLYESIKIIDKFFYITYVRNTGAAWSILSGKQIFLILFSIIVIVGIIIYLIKKKEYTRLETISYSLVLSGAVGNLIDRILYGYVIDYLNFYIFNYNFPVFNIADTCIVIGIMLLFIDMRKEA